MFWCMIATMHASKLGEARGVLEKTFGFPSFRPNQEVIIQAILDGRDVFAAMPTGGGKSLCYQLPAMMLSGLTVVISPLVALMKDQVDAAVETGIPAAFLNSSQTSAEAASSAWRRQSAKGRLRSPLSIKRCANERKTRMSDRTCFISRRLQRSE